MQEFVKLLVTKDEAEIIMRFIGHHILRASYGPVAPQSISNLIPCYNRNAGEFDANDELAPLDFKIGFARHYRMRPIVYAAEHSFQSINVLPAIPMESGK